MLRLSDDRVVARTTGERRLLARSVLGIGREYTLLGFRAADTHVHLEAVCSEAEARRFAWRVEVSLSRKLRLPVPFAKPRIKAIFDQGHLYGVFGYMFRQEQHHGIESDPFFEASNLLDLLGMRLIGDYTRDNVAMYLPRMSRAKLLGFLDNPELDTGVFQLRDLEQAAASAFAVPGLRGRGASVVEARRAAVHAVGTQAARVAEMLGIGERAVQKIRARHVPNAATVRAVRRQLELRSSRDLVLG